MDRAKTFELISETINWMTEHQAEQPDLSRLSAAVGVSPHHLQRTFQRWAGVSPKQFLKSLTRKAALARLEEGSSVLEAALDSGLSGPGRLHDLMISTDALTPGEIRKRGDGIRIDYGFGQSPFGEALVAWNARGLNFLGFCHEKGADLTLASLRSQWSNAIFSEQPSAAQDWLDRIFNQAHDEPIPIWLRGSPFQLKVWEALLEIPEGTHLTYGEVAALTGHPGAARATGTAIGNNPLAYIIPCHRVIRQVGDIGGYRWGGSMKKAIIGFEAASSQR